MYKKFKDKKPEETVQLARTILAKWGVFVTEKWYEELGDLCSLTLTIEETDFSTHGKGTGKIYALASAYGEMMERLQNMAFFRILGTTSIEDKSDFEDNTYVMINEDSELFEKKVSLWMNAISAGMADSSLLKKMKEYCEENGHVRYYKFLELNGEKNLDIPEKLIDLYYGTNGMVAGNDFYEAIVQGISEILERYVNIEILNGEITPPDITLYIKEIMPESKEWIENIEFDGSKKIEIKDMSLGKGIPAIGIIMYDLKMATYFIKIAVHPMINIAVERCFTELMQGQKIQDYFGMTNANLFLKTKLEEKNLSEILVYGSGKYPISVFENNSSYEFCFDEEQYKSNEEMAKKLESLVKKLGYEIFINNATYSEFPAYHIIVPGMSEINNKEDLALIERGINYNKVCKIVQYKLKSISKEEAKFVIKYIHDNHLKNDMQLKNLLYDIRVKDECIYGMVTIDLFLCLLHLKVQDYEKAAKSLSDYNKGLDKNNDNSRYYFCFELFLKLIASGVEKKRGITYMSKFYDEAIVQMVVNDFEHNPFEYFEPLLCKKKCISCSHQGYCITKTERKIYSKIKENFKK